MTTTKEIDEIKFEKLLVWLDQDRDQAGRKYEVIRRRLIYIFRRRRCAVPEELADETIDRVAQKVETLVETYEGDPALYFYSVARLILLEYFRRPQPEQLPEFIAQDVTLEESIDRIGCLTRCLQTLTDEQRQLFLGYHQTGTENQIRQRKLLAQSLNISDGNLRRRIFRIKTILQNCVLNCLKKKKG